MSAVCAAPSATEARAGALVRWWAACTLETAEAIAHARTEPEPELRAWQWPRAQWLEREILPRYRRAARACGLEPALDATLAEWTATPGRRVWTRELVPPHLRLTPS